MATNRVGLVIGLGVLGMVKLVGRCDGVGKSAVKFADEGVATTADVARVDKASIAIEAIDVVVEAGDDE